jgi:hypothetical protein
MTALAALARLSPNRWADFVVLEVDLCSVR